MNTVSENENIDIMEKITGFAVRKSWVSLYITK